MNSPHAKRALVTPDLHVSIFLLFFGLRQFGCSLCEHFRVRQLSACSHKREPVDVRLCPERTGKFLATLSGTSNALLSD